jgi:hypothetical protein
VRQHGLDAGGGHRQGVDDGVGRERPDVVRERGELAAVGVQVGAEGRLGFGFAAVHDEYVVAALDEELDGAPADELGSADDEYSHSSTRSRFLRGRESILLRADVARVLRMMILSGA